MKLKFHGKKISGILAVLPETEVLFDDEVDNYSFSASQTLRLKKIMGFEKHRIAKQETATSDLCVFGLASLMERNLIDPKEIGAILVATITPDYFMPHVCNIIHGRFDLPDETLCMDIPQGCCAFELGLMQAFLLLERMENKKVVLFNADVLSHKASKHDRNSFPLIGDAATITILENDSSFSDIYFHMKTDGTRCNALMIPSGGSRLPCSNETAEMKEDEEGNIRSLDNLIMDGTAVFQFVQHDVPPLIEETISEAGITKDEIEHYLFHQPNKFMLRKLAEKLEIPLEKTPMNIVENFGNPSGASVPLLIAHNLADAMIRKRSTCCLSAFGSGLAWCAMIMQLGEMDFCEKIVSNL